MSHDEETALRWIPLVIYIRGNRMVLGEAEVSGVFRLTRRLRFFNELTEDPVVRMIWDGSSLARGFCVTLLYPPDSGSPEEARVEVEQGPRATPAEEPVFEMTGQLAPLHAIREFTSETGTYKIRYIPKEGILVWTDRDSHLAAALAQEWLCPHCLIILPRKEGDRLTIPCYNCASVMMPSSSVIRLLEEQRVELDALRMFFKAHQPVVK